MRSLLHAVMKFLIIYIYLIQNYSTALSDQGVECTEEVVGVFVSPVLF